MRLTRVRKTLDEMGISYEYHKVEATIDNPTMGEIIFEDVEGNEYLASEHTTEGSKTVRGIITIGKDFDNQSRKTQKEIIEWLDKHKMRF